GRGQDGGDQGGGADAAAGAGGGGRRGGVADGHVDLGRVPTGGRRRDRGAADHASAGVGGQGERGDHGLAGVAAAVAVGVPDDRERRRDVAGRVLGREGEGVGAVTGVLHGDGQLDAAAGQARARLAGVAGAAAGRHGDA